MLNIRRARQEDREAIWRTHGSAIRGACAGHYPPEVIEVWAGRLRPEKYAEAIDRYEFFVAEEGATAVAYVLLSQNQHGWTLEEAGDRDPAGARLGAIFQVLLAREPSHALPLIRAWWPRALPVPPQLELTDRIDARDVFMVRPLADVKVPAGPDGVFYWRSDYF